ncbi:hypothetical protein ACTXIX_14735 [Glutamicibacter ardleyensis]|uniref:hypothetical protein n=1 Tax=Glutamicibacter ardleyensis TaxID=225894 RepID=UPI003FD56C7A
MKATDDTTPAPSATTPDVATEDETTTCHARVTGNVYSARKVTATAQPDNLSNTLSWLRPSAPRPHGHDASPLASLLAVAHMMDAGTHLTACPPTPGFVTELSRLMHPSPVDSLTHSTPRANPFEFPEPQILLNQT